ncbi:MAG: hypothetical protein BZ136_01100 [Methanosphaera sp. rholeuAM74]|nr:MAG: hypothetical protein BZ136_01100 [Methanosphaera sp. rholeuAM74]
MTAITTCLIFDFIIQSPVYRIISNFICIFSGMTLGLIMLNAVKSEACFVWMVRGILWKLFSDCIEYLDERCSME